MATVADVADATVGIDTHQDSHTLEMVTRTGVKVASLTVANTPDGYADAIAWISETSPGKAVFVGIEGARSYGIGIARAVGAAGFPVVDAEQPARRDRRRRGKSDLIDAHLVAVSVLQLDEEHLPTPRADGDREALRLLLVGRREIVEARTRTISRLRALLVTGTDEDRALLTKGKLSHRTLEEIVGRDPLDVSTRVDRVRRREARRLALLIQSTTRELSENKDELAEIVRELAPELLQKTGVGPVSAGQSIASWSHAGRCRSEAAFASLAGASPVEASSGKTVRHRLNRGGDRALNRTLHSIVLTRTRCCPRTRAYIERRRAEGRSDREIRRALKRYVAREIYRSLQATS